MRRLGASLISTLTFALVLCIALVIASPVSAQTWRCPSTGAGEPTDPEGTFLNNGADTVGSPVFTASPPPRLAKNPAGYTAVPARSAPTSIAVPRPHPTWIDSIVQVLRRFGIIVPKGPRS